MVNSHKIIQDGKNGKFSMLPLEWCDGAQSPVSPVMSLSHNNDGVGVVVVGRLQMLTYYTDYTAHVQGTLGYYSVINCNKYDPLQPLYNH